MPNKSNITHYDNERIKGRKLNMKRNRKWAAALLCIMMFSTGISGRLPVQAEDAQNIPVYRLYNPNTGEHLLTCKESERENLIILGWHDEGIGFYETAEGDPVYRLYNPNGSEHHYTCSEKEVNKLVKLGWRDEGTAFNSDAAETIPVYRAYNPHAWNNNHNYTVSSEEQTNLINHGWQDEDTAWYASAAGDPNAKAPGFYHYNLTYYTQLDPRWRYQYYGKYNFGSTGCVPSSLAMCLTAIKGTQILPTEIGAYLHQYGTFNNSRNASWGGSSAASVVEAAQHWGVACDSIQSLDQMVDACKHGKLVCLVVDGVNDFMPYYESHCVVVHEYHDGKASVADPYFAKNNRLWGIDYLWSIRTSDRNLLDAGPTYCFALY